jgi:hypothetical protein
MDTQQVKEIDGDDVRLYRAHVVVAYLDGSVYDFAESKIVFENPVPVQGSSGKTIGYAALFMEEIGDRPLKRVVADIVIDYACEERLLAETQEIRLWAHAHGTISGRPAHVFDFHAPIPISKVEIKGLTITNARPHDERIASLGAPVM